MQNNLRLQESGEQGVRVSVLPAERKLFQGREKKLFLALFLLHCEASSVHEVSRGLVDIRFVPTEAEAQRSDREF